jgi:excisionase family DNA binding protein
VRAFVISAKEIDAIMKLEPLISNWLTATEAAAYLQVEPRTLLMWARQGKIKGYVLSGTQRVTWRFRIEDLDATMSPPSVALTNWRTQ